MPWHHLGAVVVFGNVMVSPFLLGRCAENGRSFVWMSANGRFQARMEGPRSGNVMLRRAQHLAAEQPSATLALARGSVAGKIQNARLYLLRAARDAAEAEAAALRLAAERVERHLRDAALAVDLDTLRGRKGLLRPNTSPPSRMWCVYPIRLLRRPGAVADRHSIR